MNDDDRPKLIYLARRHPAFTPERFVDRWRAHGALGMRQARWRNVALYLQCDRVAGLLPPQVPVVEADGVAVVVYRSEAARQAHVGDAAARQTMKADERETFAQPVAQSAMLLQATQRQAGPLQGWRLFVFWEEAAEGFAAAWESAAQDWTAALQAGAIGHIRNRLVGPAEATATAAGAGAGAGAGAAASTPAQGCAGVDEFSCADPAPLVALSLALTDATAIPAVPRMALTRTAVLHDQPEAPAA